MALTSQCQMSLSVFWGQSALTNWWLALSDSGKNYFDCQSQWNSCYMPSQLMQWRLGWSPMHARTLETSMVFTCFFCFLFLIFLYHLCKLIDEPRNFFLIFRYLFAIYGDRWLQHAKIKSISLSTAFAFIQLEQVCSLPFCIQYK